jgi:hypothetical protein
MRWPDPHPETTMRLGLHTALGPAPDLGLIQNPHFDRTKVR